MGGQLMQIYHLLLMLLLSVSTLVGMPGYGAEEAQPVGRVVWVKGSFKAISVTTNERVLEKASVIYLHDTLLTGSDSQAQIVFTDNTLMTFKPKTKFSIDNYSFDAQKKKGSVGKYVMNLIEGGFRTITGLIAKRDPQSYQVNTPVATIGVRGTDYAAYVHGGELFIGYYKGKPCVTSAGKEMCLDKNHPYANVPKFGEPPRFLSKQPAVFKEKLTIVSDSVQSSSDSSFIITDTQVKVKGSKASSGTVSNFCIIQ